ncbi:phosphatidylserine lipase ABHD16A-like [Oscarella lobularis]|uniref:phosphatidylserine lipase ABHD16A-like n=1 Tax=Oscarella lobularis TaxID=121494 RepID=UPI003313EEBD
MLETVKCFGRCFLGPVLYYIFENNRTQGRAYSPTKIENATNRIFLWTSRLASFIYYASPILSFYLWRRGALTLEALPAWKDFSSRFLVGATLVLTGAFIARGFGRFANPDYRLFVAVLAASTDKNGKKTPGDLRDYDFDFRAWPVDFKSKDSVTKPNPEKRKLLDSTCPGMPTVSSVGIFTWAKDLPYNAIEYFLTCSFGRRAVYPGSTSFLQSLVDPHLLNGRVTLVKEHGGHRLKLLASDDNEIDSMFVDKRGKTDKGDKLVICSEGNAAFYEIGCMMVPLKAGYSTLGWNHPGFAGSSGLPFPSAERNAIDVVVQYAVDELGFSFDDIILWSWSIGGFASTYAAAVYPDVSCIILDATFDEIGPLSLARMPDSISSMVEDGVKNYLNLNNAEQLQHYSGPVLIIRRLHDEMISTVPRNIVFNRGNNLLMKLLKHRYPELCNDEAMNVVEKYLHSGEQNAQVQILVDHDVDNEKCLQVLEVYAQRNGKGYPCLIGQDLSQEEKIQLNLFLVTRYLIDFNATHCVEFPYQEFRMPWSL